MECLQRNTDCHNQCAHWSRNDVEGITHYGAQKKPVGDPTGFWVMLGALRVYP